MSEASGGVRPFVSRGTEQHKEGSWMVRMLLSRETPVQRSTKALLENSVCVGGGCQHVLWLLMHKRLCASMCTRPHVLGGVTHGTEWIPMDRHFQDRSLWTEREKRGER